MSTREHKRKERNCDCGCGRRARWIVTVTYYVARLIFEFFGN